MKLINVILSFFKSNETIEYNDIKPIGIIRYIPPKYNYDYYEKTKVLKILTKHFYEEGLSSLIIEYVGICNRCESCNKPYYKSWIRLPCDHYIHKNCFPKKTRCCPKCNEKI